MTAPSKALRLAFMGTPDFAVPALKALLAAGHEVVAVYSQPPRPAGRGHKERPSPVHLAAEALGIEVRTPASLKDEHEQAAFAALDLDAAVVVAYGLLLPKAVLDAPRLGCLNIHASLLPRWRGAAPIQRAIEAGDTKSGVTIMQMDEGLDTGGVLVVRETPITATITAQDLHDRLADLGAEAILDALEGLRTGTLSAVPQPDEGVTYAAKLTREEGRLDWSKDAEALERQIRAFTPWPGAWFELEGERIRVLSAEVDAVRGREINGPEGTLPAWRGLYVKCGDGAALRLKTVQRAGKKPMSDEAFVNGLRMHDQLVLP